MVNIVGCRYHQNSTGKIVILDRNIMEEIFMTRDLQLIKIESLSLKCVKSFVNGITPLFL